MKSESAIACAGSAWGTPQGLRNNGWARCTLRKSTGLRRTADACVNVLALGWGMAWGWAPTVTRLVRGKLGHQASNNSSKEYASKSPLAVMSQGRHMVPAGLSLPSWLITYEAQGFSEPSLLLSWLIKPQSVHRATGAALSVSKRDHWRSDGQLLLSRVLLQQSFQSHPTKPKGCQANYSKSAQPNNTIAADDGPTTQALCWLRCARTHKAA